jgi:Glycosyltransferase family 9 (heptosyltransferase)
LSGGRFDAALFAFARRHESAWLARAMAAAGVPRRVNLEYHDLFQDSRRPHDAFTHEGWFFWGALPSPRLLLHALDPLVRAERSGRPSRTAPTVRITPAAGAFPPAEATLPAGPPAGGGRRPTGREEARLEAHLAAGARRRAGELLAARGIGGLPFAVLAPGGRSSARWPAASFGRLAAALAGELGLAVLVEGSPDETALLREVAAVAAAHLAAGGAAPATAGKLPIAVCQDPLDVLAALLERARLLIGNDSGPLHLAAALGLPSLYFSPQEKLAHSHPQGTAASWALYDDQANDLRRITVEQALGALREMRRQGVFEAEASSRSAPRAAP